MHSLHPWVCELRIGPITEFSFISLCWWWDCWALMSLGMSSGLFLNIIYRSSLPLPLPPSSFAVLWDSCGVQHRPGSHRCVCRYICMWAEKGKMKSAEQDLSGQDCTGSQPQMHSKLMLCNSRDANENQPGAILKTIHYIWGKMLVNASH